MSVDPKKYKTIKKRKVTEDTAEAQKKGVPPPKQTSGSEAFDKAIDLMLKTKK